MKIEGRNCVLEALRSGATVNTLMCEKGKNDTIYDRLPAQFTIDQAMQQCLAIKGTGVSRNSTRMMIKNWNSQGLIYKKEHYYVKITQER